MYCPTCGANQSNEKKFCPACGTNLAAVTAALSGQLPVAAPAQTLAQAQAAYRQQIAQAINRIAPGVALLSAALLLLIIVPWRMAGFVSIGLVIGGVVALGRGLSHYYLARAELKAAELEAQTLPAPSFTPNLPPASGTNPFPPHSVTEHTTRHLG